jgi:pyruvate kinase
MSWGVNPVLIDEATVFESMVGAIKKRCVSAGIAGAGNRVVIVGGLPLGKSGTTNMVRIEAL